MKHTRKCTSFDFLQQNSNNRPSTATVHILQCRICRNWSIIRKVLLRFYFNTIKLKKQ